MDFICTTRTVLTCAYSSSLLCQPNRDRGFLHHMSFHMALDGSHLAEKKLQNGRKKKEEIFSFCLSQTRPVRTKHRKGWNDLI